MKLEFRHLELLVAVEDTGDLGGAARRLDSTLHNVTRQLARIEEHLGHAVFERRPHRLVPTAAGLEDLAIAREALRAVADIGAVQPRPSALRLLHYRTPVPGILRALRHAHPGLTTTLLVTPPAEGHRLVAEDRADAFVGRVLPHVPRPSRPDLVEEHVLTDPGVVLLPRGHRLAGSAVVDLADLAGEEWITVADPDVRHGLVQECRLVGGFDPTVVYEVADSAQVRSLVVDGLGVALGSSLTPPDAGCVQRPYTGATPSRFVTVHDPRRADVAVLRTIADLLRALVPGSDDPGVPASRHPGGQDIRP